MRRVGQLPRHSIPRPFGRAKLPLSRTSVPPLGPSPPWEGETPAEPNACPATRFLSPWEGEAPAEPNACPATRSHGSAGASPSRGSDPTARQEPRPPEDRIPRLGRSLALPRMGSLGSAGASPSQGWKHRRSRGHRAAVQRPPPATNTRCSNRNRNDNRNNNTGFRLSSTAQVGFRRPEFGDPCDHRSESCAVHGHCSCVGVIPAK